MARWPTVVEREGHRPGPTGGAVDPGLVVARPSEVVAWGSVEGVPWQIEAFVTAPGAEGKWWEHGPVGPGLEFALGENDRFGGGEAGTRLNEGTHLTASIMFFGSKPEIVAWVGVVSDEVSRVEVRPDDSEVRTVELLPGPADFPRLFWFFPPRGARGSVVAYSADGDELQREELIEIDAHPRSNAGTSVNPFAYYGDRPPPGWPDDPTEYAAGEGPRHADDFHLHEATFPIYVVPPDRWDGYTWGSGSGSSDGRLDHVGFVYIDEVGAPRFGFEVINAHPTGRPSTRHLDPTDVDARWLDPYLSDDEFAIAARFLPAEERDRLMDDFGRVDVGATRVVRTVEMDVAGHRVIAVGRTFDRLPSLRSLVFDLPGVRMVVDGWELTFDDLLRFAGLLERLELGSDLLDAMRSAGERSSRRFDERFGGP